jgi:adenine-specific DNA-methyltransferase
LSKPALSYQKLRGGYYTPKPIADFLANWAIQSSSDKILEPSCGDGIIIASALESLIQKGVSSQQAIKQIHAVEIDYEESLKAIERIRKYHIEPSASLIHLGDFFAYCKFHLSEKRFFDAIIGNPPFIRYQNFLEEYRIPAFELMNKAGLKPSKLTNTWVPFIVASSFLLNDNGRLAMIVPAELLQVNYAAQLRCFLSDYYQKITLITFKKLIFEGIQQEVVLLLAERNSNSQTGIRTIELDNISDLNYFEPAKIIEIQTKFLDHNTEKWTQYFLTNPEIELLRNIKKSDKIEPAGKVVDVDVGIVTGQNQFFVLNDEQIKSKGLHSFTRRIVSRSGHFKGIVFSESDWEANVNNNLPTYLLDFPNIDFEKLPESAKVYIKEGESAELNQGYKCRIRNRWFVVPSVWVPEAFMLRQVHAYPKIILNRSDATCTDTIHRIKLRNGIAGGTIAVAFLNSLTFAFTEVMGRSYGGGVLELEPNEAERLPLPISGAEKLDLDEIHKLLLENRIEDVLDLTDKVLLIEHLGFDSEQALMLRRIWKKLRDRRINRKHLTKSK